MLNERNTAAEEATNSITSIDRLQARLFYLVTQFSLHPCTHIAELIVKQLTSLCEHPHIELLPAQHYIYCQSINHWRSKLFINAKQTSLQIVH